MYTVQTDKEKERTPTQSKQNNNNDYQSNFFLLSLRLPRASHSDQLHLKALLETTKREHTIECKTVMAKTGTEKLNTKTQKPDMLLADNWEKSITQNVASSFHENLFCHGNHASYRKDRPLPNHSNDKRNMKQYGRQM